MSKVSVIVPVYNVEKYIKKCLESLVNQTLRDIEIIVVNDGSQDKSKEIIAEYVRKYPNIVYVEKENGGLSDARNYGMKYAKGEYIAFVDSDDYVDTTMYEKMYNKAVEEKADYVECDFYWEYPDKLKKDVGIRYSNKKDMLVYARVVAWNKLIKREIIHNEFPKGLYYEDVEFFYKLIPYINKFAFVKEPLVYYVQRENSIVNKQGAKTAQIFQVLDNVIKYYKENDLYEEYKEQLEYTYSRLLLCSSLKRIAKIQDSNIRKELTKRTWEKLNSKFPHWKKNKILKNKSGKNMYMITVNKMTIKVYSLIFHII